MKKEKAEFEAKEKAEKEAEEKKNVLVIGAGPAGLSAALYAISKICNPIDLWYNGRAVAESVKSMTWKWMMMADPYQNKNMNNESQQLLNDLHYLLQQNKSLFEHYQHEEDCHFFTISEKMKTIRAANISEKLSYYNNFKCKSFLKFTK